jgi:predicted DNA-binding transcriptional regulator YafY
MLILLKSRGKMKIQEIADELEVDKRNIIRYKDDLEQAGIYINSIPGRYGGYQMEEKDYLSSLYVSPDEYNSLMFAVEQLKLHNSPYYSNLKDLFDKISAFKKMDNYQSVNNFYFIKKIKSNYDSNKEKNYWLSINASIITSNKLRVKYNKATNEVIERVINPYAVFQYDNSFYLEGYCEDINDFRIFKLSRILSINQLNEKFKRLSNYNLKERMKECIGIYKDEELEIKIKIFYPMAQVVKEKIWVDNQKIIDYKEENYIIYIAKMKGKTQIKSWILSMGKYAEVIKPISLKEEIMEELQSIVENCK